MLDPLRFSDPIVKVYEACVDELLINLAKHFNPQRLTLTQGFRYDVELLARLGAIKKESAAIIAKHMANNAEEIRQAIEKAMLEALSDVEPELQQAANESVLKTAEMPVSEGIEQTLTAYSRQAVNQLNLVNASMVSGAANAFRSGTLAAQSILSAETGKLILGASTLQEAVKKAVKAMSSAGITGFMDSMGRNWSAEAYTRLVTKTTCQNAANQGVMDRNAQYGNDLIWVRTNATARPGCYPWQGKVISMENRSRDVTDGSGRTVHAYAASETTYGQPDGIYGCNCNHGPMNVFIPGFSVVRAAKVSKAESDKGYQLTQVQRKLERSVRYAKRDAEMLKAAGASKEDIALATAKVKQKQKQVREFVKAHPGVLVRDYSREAIYN